MSEATTASTTTDTTSVPGPYTNIIAINGTTGSHQWVTGERPDKIWSFPVDFKRTGLQPETESADVVFASNEVQLSDGSQIVLGSGPIVGCVWNTAGIDNRFHIRANPYDKPGLPDDYAVQVATGKLGNYYIDFDCAPSRNARWNLDILIKGSSVKQVDLNLSGNFGQKLPPGASSFENLAGNAVGVFIQGLEGPMKILYKLTQVADE